MYNYLKKLIEEYDKKKDYESVGILKLFSTFSEYLPVEIINNKMYQKDPLINFLKEEIEISKFEVLPLEALHFVVVELTKNNIKFIMYLNGVDTLEEVKISLQNSKYNILNFAKEKKLSEDVLLKHSNGIIYNKHIYFELDNLNKLKDGQYKLYYEGKIIFEINFLEIENNKIKLNLKTSKIQNSKSYKKKVIRKILSIINNLYMKTYKLYKGKKIKKEANNKQKDIFEVAYANFLKDTKVFQKDNLLKTNLFYDYKFMAFNKYMKSYNLSESIFKGKVKQNKKKIKKDYFKYENSPFSLNKKENLIIDNLRKVKYEDEYIDPNSFFLESELNDYAYLEYDYLKEHYLDISNKRKYLDGYYLFSDRIPKTPFQKYWDVKYKGSALKPNEQIIYLYLKHKMHHYFSSYIYFYFIFKKLEPKNVYVAGPYRSYIYAAANDLNINTIELQYAAIENKHPAFNDITYNSRDLPNEMIIFNEMWRDKLKNYIKDESKIHLKSNLYYDHYINKIKSKDSKTKDVLFLSQGTIGSKIGDYALYFAKKNPNIKVYYRLHPHETIDGEKVYKKMQNYPNIKIITIKEENIFESLKRVNKVIGVYSSALYEAYQANKRVYILKLPGYFFVKDMIEDKKFNLIENYKQLNIIKEEDE